MNTQSYLPLLFSVAICFFLNVARVHAAPEFSIGQPVKNESPLSSPGLPNMKSNPAGHCMAITIADTNCLTKTVELSAFVYYLFTGMYEPLSVLWSSGQTAHKIIVSAPGSWSWDASVTGCETNHWHTEYTLSGEFFAGNLSIQGPGAVCNGDTASLVVSSGGYNFPTFSWNPANPSGNISPYQTANAGTYALQVSDAMGCPFSTQFTVLASSIIFDVPEAFFCPGDSVEIGGNVYNQSAMVTETIPSSSGGCDTLLRHTLTFLPNPVRTENIFLCPGESVTIGGQVYNQPGTVIDKVPDPLGGCDVIVTYQIQNQTPAPSTINLSCPSAIVLYQPTGPGAVVNYPMPTASSDCICPGLPVTLSSGLPSGSNFPDGVSSVCFKTTDACGQTASCCFNVAILEENQACDVKVAGCIKYELVSITKDSAERHTYQIRVTNSCSEKLIYTAIQIPHGLGAVAPQGFSNYTAPSGNKYRVRSPNQSPFYSIRFTSLTDSIQNGESDIFKYTLPAQADVTFIRVLSKLAPNIYLEAHLNTFYCPVGSTLTGDEPAEQRTASTDLLQSADQHLFLFPNPASERVMVETEAASGRLSLFDATGRLVLNQTLAGANPDFSVASLAPGLYKVVFTTEKTNSYGSVLIVR